MSRWWVGYGTVNRAQDIICAGQAGTFPLPEPLLLRCRYALEERQRPLLPRILVVGGWLPDLDDKVVAGQTGGLRSSPQEPDSLFEQTNAISQRPPSVAKEVAGVGVVVANKIIDSFFGHRRR